MEEKMQKFRNYIYLDEVYLNSICNQISEFNKAKNSEKCERQTTVSGGINGGIAKAKSEIVEKNVANYSVNSDLKESFINYAFKDDNAIFYENNDLTVYDI